MSQTVRFEREKDAVTLFVNGRRTVTFGWKESLEACKRLDEHLRNVVEQAMNAAVAPSGETGGAWRGVAWSFRQDLGRVLFIVAGRLLFDMNTSPTGADGRGPSIAREVWRAWTAVSREAELYGRDEKGQVIAEKVARDAALLDRSGAPFGLTDDPKVQEEARSLALNDRELRRFIPISGIRSREVLGTPKVGIDTRTPFERLSAVLERLSPSERREALTQASKGIP